MAKKKRKNKKRNASSRTRSTPSQVQESTEPTLNDLGVDRIDKDMASVHTRDLQSTEHENSEQPSNLESSVQPIKSDQESNQKNATPVLKPPSTTRQKINTSSYKVQQNVQGKTQRLKSWYASLPLVKKILWGFHPK